VLSSRPPITYRAQHTYRFGVFFPDPAGSPPAVDLEMLYAGPALGLPVVDGQVPPDQLGDPQAVLRADPRLGGLRVQAAGSGETQPAAPNTTPSGADDPRGRALNRRVEISYLPRRVVAPPSSSSPPTTSTPAAGPVAVRAAHVVAGGAGATAMTAVVDPLLRRGRGRLSLVQVHLTQAAPTGGFDHVALARGDRDAGRWSVVVPATKSVLRPAADVDDLARPLTGRVNLMNGGRSYRMDLWTAAVPAGVRGVDVDLGQLGVARAVPVAP
jgi:hypothetical protein